MEPLAISRQRVESAHRNSPPSQGGARGGSNRSRPARSAWTDGASSALTRRNLLQITAVAATGWLTPLAQALAARAERSRSQEPAQSVIFLWLAGGPSQLET